MPTKEGNTNVTITLPLSMVKFIDEIVDREDLTRSQVVRAALRKLQKDGV